MFPSITITPTPPIAVKNVTFIDDLLGACLYADRPNVAVPWLLILAWCVLFASLCIELLWLLLCKWRSKDHKRRLELLSASDESSEKLLNLHLAILTAISACILFSLVLLLLPIQHTGPFSSSVYVALGILDMLILVWTSPHTGRRALSLRILSIFVVVLMRCVGVLAQDSLPQYLYPLAPTALAMYINLITGLCHLAAILASFMQCRLPEHVQGRSWQGFLALCYLSSSAGFVFLYQIGGASDDLVLCVQWVAMLLYSCLFAPALHHHFSQAQRGCRIAELERRLLHTTNGRQVSSSWPGLSPRLRAPPGALARDVITRMEALAPTVKLVYDHELVFHQMVGSGGFAEVFRASWNIVGTETTLEVAVKQLHSTPEVVHTLHAFCKEIGLMQHLQHPNVLSLLGIYIALDGTLGIVTEFLPRGSVFHLLHTNGSSAPPPLLLALRLLRDCADGMSYLHAMSPPIIHRDLKSQNLLVAADFTVKVADFGLARECSTTDAMTRVGSVQWAAPEVLLGQGYSGKCDLWSFGVVCWEIMTAKVPFQGMSPVMVASKVALEGMRLPIPQNAPRSMLRLMARCWSVVPEKRPGFTDILKLFEATEEDDGELAIGINS